MVFNDDTDNIRLHPRESMTMSANNGSQITHQSQYGMKQIGILKKFGSPREQEDDQPSLKSCIKKAETCQMSSRNRNKSRLVMLRRHRVRFDRRTNQVFHATIEVVNVDKNDLWWSNQDLVDFRLNHLRERYNNTQKRGQRIEHFQ
jgi:hypothetical protein